MASPPVTGSVDSQKLQIRTFEGSTAPQCKQVLVTGVFALRTHALRRGVIHNQNNTKGRKLVKKQEEMYRIGQEGKTVKKERRLSRSSAERIDCD